MYLQKGILLQGGKYEIVRFIASGGFGCTYEAYHPMLDKKVAIKEFFPKSFCNRDSDTSHVSVGTMSQKPLVEKLKKKFVGEARSIAKLSHNGIVKVSDVFEENGTAYYVMDYIEGKSLGEIIKERGPLSEKETLKYIHQVCDALAYVHDRNRLHLDIKPGNIMIDEEGNAKLIDFGASKQYDEENGENTSTLIGKTPGFAPIEQTGNDVSRFRPATDIYSLGATLYKCLSGKTPPEVNLLVQGDELDPLPVDVSDSTKNAIKAAMEINPKTRPQTIKEFEAILNNSNVSNTLKISEKDSEEIIFVVPKAAKSSEIKDKESSVEVSQSINNTPKTNSEETQIQSNHENEPVISTPSNNPDRTNNPDRKVDVSNSEFEVSPNSKSKLYLGIGIAAVLALVCWIVFGGKSDSGTINGHEWVDLGLPSGLKWATCNVGSINPEDSGSYFAWGETKTKSTYDESNSKTYGKDTQWLGNNGYLDSLGNLSPSHDVAKQYWGGSWRMPTLNEINELMDNTNMEWTTRNEINGLLITSKNNGNSIFLPASGYQSGSWLYVAKEQGGYWSSTPDERGSDYAYSLGFGSDNLNSYWSLRGCGRSVRPVSE